MSEFFDENFVYLLTALKYLYWWAPLWLPVLFGFLLFKAWLYYRRELFWSKQEKALIEIKLPKEVNKSPLAMETVLNVFYNTLNEATWVNRYWEGKTRPWFSLEIVSIGGDVKFFIWTWKAYKNSIENQIYSQYPGVEIYDAKDYTLSFDYKKDVNDLWICEWKLTEPDPYPIKTYVDYGLDKDLEEEFKIDPMTPLIEYLGSLTEGHMVWVQIIIRAHKKEQKKKLTWSERWEKFAWSETIDAWKEEAKKEKDKIIEKLKTNKEGGFPRIPTKGEAEKIAALERSISKLPFDVGIRTIYCAPKNIFSLSNLGGLIGGFRQYSSPDLNGFAPKGWLAGYAPYPWQDIFGKGKEWRKKRGLYEYKMRTFFYSYEKQSKPFVLNTEELATIYHFPGSVAGTPNLGRIPSRKSEPPSNLPI